MKIVDNMSQLKGYIKQYQLEKVIQEELLEYCSIQVFEKGEYLCGVDQEATFFFFFVQGKAKIYTLLENGKKLLLRFYLPFHVLGDIEIINQNKYKVFAEALTQCTCIAVPMKFAKAYGLKNPDFLLFLCQHLAEKLDTITHKSSINVLCPLEVRLASYIFESHNPRTNTFEVQSNYSDLAELLGTSYRHLNRMLIQFADKGILEKNKKVIKIIDMAALKDLAGDLYM